MPRESRVKKSLLNARVNTICYFASLLVAFFTRKVLLDNLGAEFIGLTGTLGSLLGFLNVAELGVGTAIGYVLYRPLYDQDLLKINDVVSVLGYLYRCIGLIVVFAGILLSLFLPIIFSDTDIPLGVIYLGFYIYLAASAIGYFANYRMVLLSADQRNYIVTGFFQLSISAKVILQMIQAVFWGSFYIYLLLELLMGITNAFILQRKIKKTYPWLTTDINRGHELFKDNPMIGEYIKQVFVHKIASFVQFQLSPFLIYAYVSLPMVAIYSNYTIVIQRIQNLFIGIMGSTWAGVGDLISEADRSKTISVYKGLLSFNIFFGGFISASVYVLISPFINIWLGDGYELSSFVVLLISLQLFLQTVRGVNDQFISGFGLFYDIWAPLAESVLFIGSSIVLGTFYGLPGILAGPLISTLCIVYGWKPFFLFNKGFKLPHSVFIHTFAIDMTASVTGIFIATKLYQRIEQFLIAENGWLQWIIQSFVYTTILGFLSIITFGILSADFRTFCVQLYLKTKKHG